MAALANINYAIQFSRQLTQKNKVWCDGTLEQKGRKINLYDDTHDLVESGWRGGTALKVGTQIKLESHLVKIISIEQEGDSEVTTEVKTVTTTKPAEPQPPRGIRPATTGLSTNTGKSLGARPTIQKAQPAKKSNSISDSTVSMIKQSKEITVGKSVSFNSELNNNTLKIKVDLSNIRRLQPPPSCGRSTEEILSLLKQT